METNALDLARVRSVAKLSERNNTMKIKVERGYHHNVRSDNGCTVTQIKPNGETIVDEIPAGKTTAVFAFFSEFEVSDDTAVVQQLFKLAPQQKLALLGVLGGGVSAWFKALKTELTALLDGSKFELAWMSAENTLVVHTDRVSDELLAAVKATAEAAMPATATLVQYNHNIEIPYRDINKYAECVTVADMEAVNPDYKADLTSDGEWCYPLPKLTNADYAFDDSGMKKFNVDLPEVTSAKGLFCNPSLEGEMTLHLPKCVTWSQILCTSSIGSNIPKLNKVTFVANPDTKSQFHQAFSHFRKDKDYYLEEVNLQGFTGENIGGDSLCLNCCALKRFRTDTVGTVVYWNAEAFSECQLDKESIFNIVKASWRGEKKSSGWKIGHFGIHVDYKYDEEVQAALAELEENGWTLSIRWNGTPTSTASTMAMGTLIYAKPGEMERPDGTTERYLDWGHYVTNWEERGYEQFRSLESAYRYFGLPMPMKEESQPTE